MLVKRNVRKEILENGIVKKTFDIYNDGGCQCFHDCYCYLDRGFVKRDVITFDNCSTMEEALFKQQQSEDNKKRLNEEKLLAQEWIKSIPQKKLFKIISNFKQQNKSLKRFNHHEIINSNKILQVYYWFKKQLV